MAINFNNYVRTLEGMGLLDVVLPFILFFTILFAALQKTKILGDKSGSTEGEKAGKKYNVVVALVFGLVGVIPHVLYGGRPDDGKMQIGSKLFPDPVEIINNSLPSVAIWVIAILMFLLILGLLIPVERVLQWPVSGWAALLAVLVIGYIFGSAAGWWGEISRSSFVRSLGLSNPNNLFGVLVLLVFGLVLYLIVKDPGDGKSWENIKGGIKGSLDSK